MSLLNVTGLAIRDPESDVAVSGARWQPISRQSPTPNPQEASLNGSWELWSWELKNND